MLFAKNQPPVQYGLSCDDKGYYYIQQAAPLTEAKRIENPKDLMAEIPYHATVIYAVPHQRIWRKVFFLSKQHSKADLHRQILQFLQQALPIPLTEIYFDYHITLLSDVYRIAVFALRKNIILPPLPNMMRLDCELHCLARAILHLTQHPFEQIEQFHFPFQQQFFRLHTKGLEFFDNAPEQSLLLQAEVDMSNPECHLIALGASLWNGSASI